MHHPAGARCWRRRAGSRWATPPIRGRHLFCKTCGIYPYHGDAEHGYRVNLGCVEQIDPLALEIRILDGRSMPLSDDPGPHPDL